MDQEEGGVRRRSLEAKVVWKCLLLLDLEMLMFISQHLPEYSLDTINLSTVLGIGTYIALFNLNKNSLHMSNCDMVSITQMKKLKLKSVWGICPRAPSKKETVGNEASIFTPQTQHSVPIVSLSYLHPKIQVSKEDFPADVWGFYHAFSGLRLLAKEDLGKLSSPTCF
jgi:hypothetical protein